MKRTLALASLASLLGTTLAWADPASPPPTFEEALAAAQAKGKPLVLEFWASW